MIGPDARRLRRRAKITQAEVATRIGITEDAYRAWEKGRRGLAYERTIDEVFTAIRDLTAEKGTG